MGRREATKGTARGVVLLGLLAHEVRVTAHAAPCMASAASLSIEGLPNEGAAREARVRLSSAGLGFDNHRVAVLVEGCPRAADARPLDLPIAVAIMRAVQTAQPVVASEDTVFVGELALSGGVLPLRGTLASIEAVNVPELDAAPFIVPGANVWEASVSTRADSVRTIVHLHDLFDTRAIRPLPSPVRRPDTLGAESYSDLPPSHQAALEIARGLRRVLLVGPPGSGKTMVARRVGIDTPLTPPALREVVLVHGVAGLVSGPLSGARPFRAPHYTASETALVGGGDRPRPGEVSLAHRGVLFLDELTEFTISAVDAMGRVLRDRVVRLPRNDALVEFPAEPFAVVAAANPCPCARPRGTCTCSADALHGYRRRLDRHAAALGITTRVELPSGSMMDVRR